MLAYIRLTGELYVLSKEKFEANWEQPGFEIDDDSQRSKEFKKRGYKQYEPLPNFKMLYEVSAADLERMPVKSFQSAWGAVQPVAFGDFFAMPAPPAAPTEVYLMPPEIILNYSLCEVCQEGERQPPILLQSMKSRPMPAEELARAPSVVKHRTQRDMVELFKERILVRGQLMRKVQPMRVRLGKPDETIVTCVNGRVISEFVINNKTTMVVRGAIHYELYCLPQKKFIDDYILPRQESAGLQVLPTDDEHAEARVPGHRGGQEGRADWICPCVLGSAAAPGGVRAACGHPTSLRCASGRGNTGVERHGQHGIRTRAAKTQVQHV